MDEVERLVRRQAGVVSRRQALSLGMSEVQVARLVRRRVWVAVHGGVYVDHTGPPSRRQREWAALLLHPGSVLAGFQVRWVRIAGGRRIGAAGM